MVPVPLEMYLSFFVANYSSTFARLEGGGAAASSGVSSTLAGADSAGLLLLTAILAALSDAGSTC